MDDDDAHRTAAPGDRRGDLAVQTVEQDIGLGIAEPQIAQMQPFEKILRCGPDRRLDAASESQ